MPSDMILPTLTLYQRSRARANHAFTDNNSPEGRLTTTIRYDRLPKLGESYYALNSAATIQAPLSRSVISLLKSGLHTKHT